MNVPWKRLSTIGRELDQRFAILTGEAAQQKVKRPEPTSSTSAPVPLWETVPSGPGKEPGDYYRLPLLKQPVWVWTVPSYFYLGGVAGGAALLAALLRGKRPVRQLAASCRWFAFLGTTVGPALLTWDLGKMQRFPNMLRVLRPTSPMSIGSWVLAASGALSTLTLLQGGRESSRWPSAALAGGGVMLAGYTGVLLSNTANPLWSSSRKSLPMLFTASSMASSAALLELLPLNETEEKVVQRFGTIGKLAETAGMAAMEREASRNPEAASNLGEGKAGTLWKAAKALVTAGAILSVIPAKSPVKRRAGGLLSTLGAIALRYALLESGKQAAVEPQAVLRYQRRRRPARPEVMEKGSLPNP